MAVKVTKGQICNGIVSKEYVTRNTTFMESFIIVSKNAQLLYYATLTIVSTRSPEPPPNIVYQRGEHVFTPNGFVLEQACFHVVNMFARLNRPY